MSHGPPDPAAAAESSTRVFVDHRELLFSIVYSMLGSVADTEDVLQETWLAWDARGRASDGEPVMNPRAYLVRVAVNRALVPSVARNAETPLEGTGVC